MSGFGVGDGQDYRAFVGVSGRWEGSDQVEPASRFLGQEPPQALMFAIGEAGEAQFTGEV